MTTKDPNLWGQGGVLAAILAVCGAIYRLAGKLTGAKIKVIDPDCERKYAELELKYETQGKTLLTQEVKLAVALERIASLEATVKSLQSEVDHLRSN